MKFIEYCDRKSNLLILEFLLHEDKKVIPTEHTDSYFVPPKNFNDRKRARKFLEWLKKYGVPVDDFIEAMYNKNPVTPPKMFGSGTVGNAYPIGDFVVKFTTDEKEASFALKIAGQDLPVVTKIYDVINLGTLTTTGGSTQTLFAILQQKLGGGIAKKTRIAGNAVYDYLDNFVQPLTDIDAAYKHIVASLPKKYAEDAGICGEIRKLLNAVKALQDTSGVTYRDPQPSNLLYKGRDLAFFDLGRATPLAGTTLPQPRSLD